MDEELTLKIKKNRDLSEQELADIIALCSRAFNVDYRNFLNTFIGATHVLGYYENTLVSHALWVTRWLQVGDSPLMRTAYIEGVATDESYRKRGFATVVMKRLAEEIVKDVVAIADCEEKVVSVAFEEVNPEDWAEKVYKPEILEKQEKLYKKPGYNPFE